MRTHGMPTEPDVAKLVVAKLTLYELRLSESRSASADGCVSGHTHTPETETFIQLLIHLRSHGAKAVEPMVLEILPF